MATALTEVEFHTGVADRIGFACRLLRKASRQGARVLVTAPDEVLAELDRALWVFEERDFLPHVRMPGARPAVAARTPVWLARDAASAEAAGAPRLVLNLGAAAPHDVASLERLIEVVSAEPDDAEQGRQRWRAYKAAGLEIKHHAAAGAGRE
jgi:DNA polymerase III subunit chi